MTLVSILANHRAHAKIGSLTTYRVNISLPFLITTNSGAGISYQSVTRPPPYLSLDNVTMSNYIASETGLPDQMDEHNRDSNDTQSATLI